MSVCIYFCDSTAGCSKSNRSQCFNVTFTDGHPDHCKPPSMPTAPLPFNMYYGYATLCFKLICTPKEMKRNLSCFHSFCHCLLHFCFANGLLTVTENRCKDTAAWKVCIPLVAPVNIYVNYANWGPVVGNYSSLKSCLENCY